MKLIFLAFGILLISAHCGAKDFQQYLDTISEAHKAWKTFKKEFGIEYNTILEEGRRFKIFSENFMRVREHNFRYAKGKESYNMSMNRMSVMTPKEVSSFRCLNLASRGYKTSNYYGSTYLSPTHLNYTVPDEIDWRQKGAVTPVKNQGHCGSCWAFSTTGSIEGQWYRKTGKLVSLSEQQLVDCAGGVYGNNGCNGGIMDEAFEYVRMVGGLDSESNYPYVSGETEHKHDYCEYRRSEVKAKITGYMDVPRNNEGVLKEAVALHGPISIAIDANLFSFMHYSGGVYDDVNCLGDAQHLNHGVLLVGYGTLGGKDYWLVKNSWGAQWGDNGYIKIRRNANNMCGVASMPSYPLV